MCCVANVLPGPQQDMPSSTAVPFPSLCLGRSSIALRLGDNVSVDGTPADFEVCSLFRVVSPSVALTVWQPGGCLDRGAHD